jgi:signal transduction histidine kinase/ligand-binding sensor domain-containing protein
MMALPGTSERLPVRLFNIADGLASAKINRIVRDSRGFLWLCTEEGVTRFDGYTFSNYGTDQGLPDRSATDLLETPDGEYWVSTFKGLTRFDPYGAGKGTFFAVYKQADVARASQIAQIALGADGDIWCSTAAGLYRFDRKHLRFEAMVAEPPGGWWTAMLPDRDGSLWFGSDMLAHRLPDGHIDRYGPAEGFAKSLIRVSDILRDRRGRLWVATWAGLYRMTPAPAIGRNSVERIYTERDGLPNHTVFSLFQSSTGRLLVGHSLGGAFEFVEGNGSTPDRFRSLAGKNGLEIPEVGIPSIDTMGEDVAGNIWLSRAMRVAKAGFVSYGMQDGLKTNDIGSIFEDVGGRLTVLTCDPRCRFINTLDGGSFAGTKPRLPDNIEQVTWGFGQIHLQDHTGIWWVATEKGLCRYPRVSRVADLARIAPERVYTKADGLQGDEVFRIFEDSKGDLWLSTLGANVVGRWRRAADTIESYSRNTNGGPLDVPTVFAEDHAGSIWVGFYGPNLARYRQGRFEVFTASEGMPQSSIRSLFVDHAGRLWIGTGREGLVRVDQPSAEIPRFQILTTRSGLSSNEINAITEDRQGKLYMGTGRGIDRLDPATGHIRHYTAAEGLGFSATPRIAYRDRQGAHWFGGAGLLRFLPPVVDEAWQAPAIRISRVAVAGAERPISELGEHAVDLHTLGAAQNDLHIEFAALSFAVGQTLRYQYRLEGIDSDWGAPTEQRSISYAALPAGRYRFLVRAVNSDGVVSDPPASIRFAVALPFWLSPWVVASMTLLAASAILGAHRYRVGQLLKVERIRTDIATDLHDDIGATLSQISLLTGLARKDIHADHLQLDSRLAHIGDLSRGLVDAMSEIVWALNPQHDHLSDLASRMRRFASDVFTAGEILFEFAVPAKGEDQGISPETRRQVFLIFKECVNNIVKHAACRRVRAVLQVQPQRIHLTLIDDGKGISSANSFEGNGMASIRRRARSLGANLTYNQEPGGGTRIDLAVPIGGRRGKPLPEQVAGQSAEVVQNE